MKLIDFISLLLPCDQVYAVPYILAGKQSPFCSQDGWEKDCIVDTQGALPTGANCGDGNRFLIEPGAPMQKEMVSLLLMAMQNKVPATLYVDGCSGGVMKLKSVSISKG